MAAVTFAEAGEWETARQLAPLPRRGGLLEWIVRHVEAAAFAEEGMHEEALRIVGAEPPPRDDGALEVLLGVQGVRMFCGVLSPAVLAPRR